MVESSKEANDILRFALLNEIRDLHKILEENKKNKCFPKEMAEADEKRMKEMLKSALNSELKDFGFIKKMCEIYGVKP